LRLKILLLSGIPLACASIVEPMRSLGVPLLVAFLCAGCGAPDPGSSEPEAVLSTSEAIESSDVLARAQSWVDAQVPYCQAPNHGWDAVCQKTCNRTGAAANPEWDPYRSDCSGFVSYAWGLPPPGKVVSQLAQSSVTTKIDATELQPGDAIHASDTSHIMLFDGWVTPYSKMRIMQEGNCGKVAEVKEYNVQSLSGSTVHFSWDTYVAVRFNSISFTPPSCDRTAGPFTFSCDGEQPDLHCVNVDEPEDPDTWSDNYFCSTMDLGMQWSSSGPIDGMDCTAVSEAAEPEAAAWSDNYLCVPKQSPYAFSYSSAGPIEGKTCVQWNEPADTGGSWGDNYVCADPVYAFSAGGFSFSGAGALDGEHCVSVDEPSDPDTWSDNYFCSHDDVGLVWSYAGPVDGMDCTNVTESAEEDAAAWSDNYLCLPADSNYRLTWSSAGPIDGQTCVRWFDHAEKSATWLDNWMCIEDLTAPDPTGSGGGGSGGSGVEPGGSGGSGAPTHQATRVVAANDGGCAIGGSRTSSGWELLGALGALALVRRRQLGRSSRFV
jgi:hypothetical protein